MNPGVTAENSRCGSIPVLVAMAGLFIWPATRVAAQEGQTLHEVLETSDVVVIAELIRPQWNLQGEPIVIRNGQSQSFEVTDVMQGSMHIGIGDRFMTRMHEYDPDIQSYLIHSRETGDDDDQPWRWSDAYAITPGGLEYLEGLPKGFVSLDDRLSYFWNALEHDDGLVSRNAHLEFALVSDEELARFKDGFDRVELLNWLRKDGATKQERALYYMLLSMCGTAEDGTQLRELVMSGELPASDAMMACFMVLVGASGMPWIEEAFLENEDVDYAVTYQAILAIRYLLQHKDAPVSRERLIESLRLILTRPLLADLVITDLARFGDWDSMADIAKLYELTDEEASWLRVPAINYMRACPRPEAKEYLKQFEQSDKDSFKRAMTFYPELTPATVKERTPVIRIRPIGQLEANPFCWIQSR